MCSFERSLIDRYIEQVFSVFLLIFLTEPELVVFWRRRRLIQEFFGSYNAFSEYKGVAKGFEVIAVKNCTDQ